MTVQPDVSVLVPVLNEEAHLPDAARAMLDQQLDGDAEFLFIDGGSRDATPLILAELAASDSRVRVLENPHRRTPQALNIGLRNARGNYIARMDAHTIYPPRYLAAGLERLRQGDVESVSGPQLAVGRSPGSRRVARALTTSLGTGGARFRNELAGEIEVDTGFTGMWRRSTLEELGGWDEEWINDQDVELAARIRKRGGRIVCIPEMAASYIPRDTMRALARQYFIYGSYRVKTARRHPESLRPSQLLPPGLVTASALAAASPAPLRAPARLGLAVYAAAVLLGTTRAAVDGAGAEAAALPLVWATMHYSYGTGFVSGCLRLGPPMRALTSSLPLPARRNATRGLH